MIVANRAWLTLESSSYVLEMANDSLTTFTQNLIDFSILSQRFCKLFG